jgi:hypothetical protein
MIEKRDVRCAAGELSKRNDLPGRARSALSYAAIGVMPSATEVEIPIRCDMIFEVVLPK